MNERVKKIFYKIADWTLNLSIVLTIVLMGLSIWGIVQICFIHKNDWIRVSQPPESVQPNPEMMKILDELEKKDGKN
jgi:hypothetical protein